MTEGMKYQQSEEGGVYHCMSRCVQGRRLLNKREQGVFRRMLERVAEFSGVEVITFCIMHNHFHILIRVPARDTEPTDAELVRRYHLLYPKASKYAPVPPHRVELVLAGDEGDALREWLLRRMHDVSEFMRTLNLRFSLWYNRTHELFGAFWASRFKAVLIEDKQSLVSTVAAYVDLNPVRAGLVEDPKDYRFSGYGEAVAGCAGPRERLCRLMQADGEDEKERMAAYRRLLFCRAMRPAAGKAAVADEAADRVLKEERGHLTRSAVAGVRLRFFIEGAVLGSAEFVRGFLGSGTRKKPRETGAEGVCALRGPRER